MADKHYEVSMDEPYRFLRYVMPGLVFGIETLLFVYIVFPQRTIAFITTHLAGKDSLGIALGSLFASGALGYIFATAHHWWYWKRRTDEDILNNVSIINRLIENKLIPPESDGKPIDREKAFVIAGAQWHGLVEPDTPYALAGIKLDSIGNLAHAAGASRVASFFALLTALYASANYGAFSNDFCVIFRFLLMIGLGIALIYLFNDAFRRLGNFAQSISDRILERLIAETKT